VSFTRVEEDELEEIRRLALEDRYSYHVEDERDRRGAGDP